MAATLLPIQHEPAIQSSLKSPQPKSILRTPVSMLGRRTRDDYEEDDDESESSNAAKRRKTVVFDMELNTVQELAKRSFDDIKREVFAALKELNQHETSKYDALKELFSNSKPKSFMAHDGKDVTEEAISSSELALYVKAITAYVPLLGRSASGLVKEMLSTSWLGRDSFFATVYTNFLCALVTGQPVYLAQTLNMCVDNFRDSTAAKWSLSQHPETAQKVMADRLHDALARILDLVPAAVQVLLPILCKEFPHADETRKEHIAFLLNVVRLRDYAPVIGPDIMDLILDRLVKIDVQMHVDLDEVDDDIAAGVLLKLRDSERLGLDALNGDDDDDQDDDNDDDDESVNSDDDENSDHSKILRATQYIRKMDGILDVLFRLYEPSFRDPDSEEAKLAFEELLSQFFHVVLPTYSSRHSQFLVFHFSQRSQWLSDRFAGALITVAFGTNQPMMTRQNATAYLASFVARAARMSPATVRNICQVLILHIESYRIRHSSTAKPELRRFTPYYALFQGLMYIFCFRWRDLVVETPDYVDRDDPLSLIGQDLVWVKDLQRLLETNIFSKFNPLRVCHPTIVHEFAKMAGHLRFLYIHDKIGSNRQVFLASYVSSSAESIREITGRDAHDESWLQLAPYFPFDPYQLPESRHWMDGDYIEYKPFPELNDHLLGQGLDSDDEDGGLGEEGLEDGTSTDGDDDDSD